MNRVTPTQRVCNGIVDTSNMYHFELNPRVTMPGEGGPNSWPAAWLLMLIMAAAYNQLTVNLEGPTQQWISRHYPTYLLLYCLDQ